MVSHTDSNTTFSTRGCPRFFSLPKFDCPVVFDATVFYSLFASFTCCVGLICLHILCLLLDLYVVETEAKPN